MDFRSKVDLIDELLSSRSKTLDDFQPHWTYQSGYNDHQLAWPVYEEDRGVTRSQLRIRIPEQHPEFCSISFLHRGDIICRLDKDSDDVCKANHPFARNVRLPPYVCGLHIHDWKENRQFILQNGIWDIPLRRSVEETLDDVNVMFFWFCDHINVRIQSHNTPLQLPDVGLWGPRC